MNVADILGFSSDAGTSALTELTRSQTFLMIVKPAHITQGANLRAFAIMACMRHPTRTCIAYLGHLSHM